VRRREKKSQYSEDEENTSFLASKRLTPQPKETSPPGAAKGYPPQPTAPRIRKTHRGERICEMAVKQRAYYFLRPSAAP